jgi:predicted dehydrogenase
MAAQQKYLGAVIGLGNIGFKLSLKFDVNSHRPMTWSHTEAFRKCERTALAGAVEIDPENIKIFKKHCPDVPVYPSVKELFAHHKIDIVSIATPVSLHSSSLKEVLAFPVKAVFCEKPLAAGIQEAEQMVEMCEAKKVVLAVNHTRRWDSNYLLAKRMIAEGKIGRVRAVSATYTAKVFNIGSHLFDTIRMLIDKDPERVSGLAPEGDSSDLSISGWIQFRGGIPCVFLCNDKATDLIFEIEVIGEKGRLRVISNGDKIEWAIFLDSSRYPGAREFVDQPVHMEPGNDRFVEAMNDIAAVLDGKKKAVACSGKDGLWALWLCCALTQSAQKKGEVITADIGVLC